MEEGEVGLDGHGVRAEDPAIDPEPASLEGVPRVGIAARREPPAGDVAVFRAQAPVGREEDRAGRAPLGRAAVPVLPAPDGDGVADQRAFGVP